MRPTKVLLGAACAAGLLFGASVGPAAADPGVHKVSDPLLHDGSPPNPRITENKWFRESTNAGGTVANDAGVGAPTGQGLGTGALKLTTDETNTAKAQLFTNDDVYGVSLVTVSNLNYWTKQVSSTQFPDADPSYQVTVDLDGNLGTTGDRTNLVYEPYWNDLEGPDPQQPITGIVQGDWQHWNTSNGDWWSSQQIGNADGITPSVCGLFHVEPGAGGPPFTRPSEVGLMCPLSKVVAIGVNVGTYNPGYVVAADGLHLDVGLDSYTFNFEPGPK